MTENLQPVLPGIYTDLSNEDYHADKAVGSSGIKEFIELPALYCANYLAPLEGARIESRAQRIGSYSHVSLLEPELFASKYKVAPEFAVTYAGKKNEGRAIMNKTHTAWKEFAAEAEAEGKEPLLYGDFIVSARMTEVIKRHPLATSILQGGKSEMSFFIKDPETGIMLKARPDKLNKLGDRVILVDYKTTGLPLGTKKQSDHAFGLKRHIQAAHHKTVTEIATGTKIDEVIYVTQQQQYPHLIRCFRMSPASIQRGMEERRMALDGMADCIAKNEWPDYPHEIEDLIEPKWMDSDFN